MTEGRVLFERDRVFKALIKKISNNIYRISYPSPFATGDKKNDSVQGILYRADGERLLVFLHGLNTTKEFQWIKMARRLFLKGVSTFFMHLPYHLGRGETPYASRKKVNFMDGVFSYYFFKQAGLDVLRGLDLMEFLGYSKFAISGVSLGGIVATISSAMDQRVSHLVLISTGGDHEIITWESIALSGMRRSYHREGITREVCHNCRLKLNDFIKAVEKSKNPYLVKNRVICFYFDPLSFAPLLKGKEVLMITGRFDRVMPQGAVRKLWEALSRPEIFYLPTGHIGVSWRQREIASLIEKFFSG